MHQPLLFRDQGRWEDFDRWVGQSHFSNIHVLVDANTAKYCLPVFREFFRWPLTMHTMPAGEPSKQIKTASHLWEQLLSHGADRKSLLINLGGGIVTDMGGFVAATYMRGITFVNIPTTLLGMTDAAHGGKTGVDIGNFKNMVGTFTTPGAVVIDMKWLQTLPEDHFRSGIAEVIKHGIIRCAPIIDRLMKEGFRSATDESLIHHAMDVKLEVIHADPLEHGMRRILNYGHTIGHAIESHYLSMGIPIMHGDAVAAGMWVEAIIANLSGLLSDNHAKLIIRLIHDIFERQLPNQLEIKDLMPYIHRDKKNASGVIRMALPVAIGRADPGVIVSHEGIEKAVMTYNKR